MVCLLQIFFVEIIKLKLVVQKLMFKNVQKYILTFSTAFAEAILIRSTGKCKKKLYKSASFYVF